MLGRFRTEDPIRDGLNWYVYANNNPIMFIDPWGLAVTSWDLMNVTDSNDQKQLILNTKIWDDLDSTKAQRDAAAASSKAIRAKYMSANQTQLASGYVITTFSVLSAPSTFTPINQPVTPPATFGDVGMLAGGIALTDSPAPGPADVVAAGALAVGTGYVLGNSIQELFAKESRTSDKEKANDVPSWSRGEKPQPGESGKDFAKRLLDQKYGAGNYPTGPGSEYNRLKKYGDRGGK